MLLQVTKQVVGILNNVVDLAVTDTSGDNEMPSESTDSFLNILMDFEEQIKHATDSGENIDPVVETNVVFTSVPVSPDTELRLVITHDKTENTEDEFSEGHVKLNQDVPTDDVRTSITLPVSLFHDANGL